MLLRTTILIVLAGLTRLYAQDRSAVEPAALPAPDQSVKPVKASVEKISETEYRIGKVILNKKNREIRVPTKVNMVEGLLEYLVVHENGKLHESLLHTTASPTHINLAFTLLRYPASRELYALPNGRGGISDQFPEVPPEVKAGARVAIDVEWNEAGRTRRNSVNEWIQHSVKTTAMPQGPWVYGGSDFHGGKYVPESTGDIAAIFITSSALLNYPGEDNWNDDVWLPFTKRVPPEGTPVTLIFSPYPSSKPIQKP